jgi:hypothetical protein
MTVICRNVQHSPKAAGDQRSSSTHTQNWRKNYSFSAVRNTYLVVGHETGDKSWTGWQHRPATDIFLHAVLHSWLCSEVSEPAAPACCSTATRNTAVRLRHRPTARRRPHRPKPTSLLQGGKVNGLVTKVGTSTQLENVSAWKATC